MNDIVTIHESGARYIDFERISKSFSYGRVLVRDEYEIIYDLLKKAYEKGKLGAVVVGQPGIGKDPVISRDV